MVNAQEQKHLTALDDQANESSLSTMLRKEMKQHLKKLRQIKKDLKKHPTGTPLRKRDRITIDNK